MVSIEVLLPTGFAVDDGWHRESELHPINGADEEFIGQFARLHLPVERDTMILTRCVTRLGPKSPVSADDVRALIAGDRDALLLHLRRLTFGNKIRSVLACPAPQCGEKMDLEFLIEDIMAPPNLMAKRNYEMEIIDTDAAYRVKFRLPTGADLETVSKTLVPGAEGTLEMLLLRCVDEIKRDGNKEDILDGLPETIVEVLSARMGELDSQAEIKFNLTCPACDHRFQANFEIGDFLFREIMADLNQLYQEVHLLAFHYHWSEEDIIRMSRSKRRIYLRLLAEALNPEDM